jgi:hypothetical protein
MPAAAVLHAAVCLPAAAHRRLPARQQAGPLPAVEQPRRHSSRRGRAPAQAGSSIHARQPSTQGEAAQCSTALGSAWLQHSNRTT